MKPADRIAPIAVTAALQLFHASPALAQEIERSGSAWVVEDTIGAPVAMVTTPVLIQNAWYEIQTWGLAPAEDPVDTVVAIRTSPWPEAQTLGGGDACLLNPSDPEDWQIERTCIRFRMPVASTSLTLWIRGWETGSRGRTGVRIQQVASETAMPDPGQWTVLVDEGQLTFGGTVVPDVGPAAAQLVQFESTHLPRSDLGWTHQNIYFVPGNNDDWETNYDFAPNLIAPTSFPVPGEAGSHRRGLGGTAEWVGFGSSVGLANGSGKMTGTVVAGGSSWSSGPIRVMRNDRAQFVTPNGVFVSGVDGDGDELGRSLEEALLETCDATTSPVLNGLSCATRPGCDLPGSDACEQALRDSDEDGIRDDVEVYGFGPWTHLWTDEAEVEHSEPRAEVPLPAWGSNPARYDVFVELDYQATSFAGSQPLCHGASMPFITGGVDFFDPGDPSAVTHPAGRGSRTSQVYQSVSNAAFPNRDGTQGVFVHWDSYVADDNSPATRVGDFGGSECVGTPCSNDAECVAAQEEGTCSAGVCTNSGNGARDRWLRPERRWLFHHLLLYSGGSGKAGVVSLAGVAGGVWEAVHELGHQGGLTHPGVGDATIPTYRINYPSRINYQYESIGTFDDPSSWASVSFSEGELESVVPTAVSEHCPLGAATTSAVDPLALINTATLHAGRMSGPPACPDFDLDHDGIPLPAGQVTEAQMWEGTGFEERATRTPAYLLAAHGASLAVAGDTLFRFEIGAQFFFSGTARRLLAFRDGSVDCDPEPGPFGSSFPACWDITVATSLNDTDDTPVEPDAIAAAGTVSGVAVAVLVWAEPGGTLRWGTLSESGVWAPRGALPGASALPASADDRQPALAQLGSTGTLILTYRDSLGQVVEQTAVPDSVGGFSWTAPVTVYDDGGVTSALGSPGIATATGGHGDGVVMILYRAAGASQYVVIMSRSTAGAWTEQSWFGTDTDLRPVGLRGRPGVAVRPYRVGGSVRTRLHVFYLFDDATTFQARSDFDSFVDWEPLAEVGSGARVFAEAVVYDDRPESVPNLLRGERASVPTCSTDADCIADLTCQEVYPGGSLGCRSSTGLWLTERQLLPAIDGIAPIRSCDTDDWERFRYGFCQGLRQLREEAPSFFDDDDGSCPVLPAAWFQYCP